MDAIRIMREMFDAAIASAQPQLCVPPHLPDPGDVRGRLVVIGAGKASAAMARAVEDHWPGPVEGLVVTRYGYGVECKKIEILEAAHPVPDEAGLNAAQRLLEKVSGLSKDDVVLCLISGGGSALLPMPLAGISLSDKQWVSKVLLASGATISEMNTVRRHLSAIKGGRLAAVCHPARVMTLLLSDVPGDHPIDIASGPTVADPTTCGDALEIIRRYQIRLPDHVLRVLTSGDGESIKPDDIRLSSVKTHIVAAPQQALEAAAQVARRHGYTPYILSDAIEGEAKEVGKVLAAISLQIANRGEPFPRKCALLSGGETTVTLKGNGRGGRSVECLLSFLLETRGRPGIYALMGDTDGVDGVEEIAGASIAPATYQAALDAGLSPRKSLESNDGHGFFQAIGRSVITGPTMTNVNDFRVVLINE